MEINKELGLKYPLDHPDAKRLNLCVNMVLDREAYGTLIVSGEGLGKTRHIRNIINNRNFVEGEDWIHVNHNITDTQMYIILYENRDKIIFFDDIGEVAKTKAGVTIMKQATETIDGKKRMVGWMTPHAALKNYPPEFEFNGWLITCLNSEPNHKNPNIKALISRMLSCEFFPSNKTILEMMWALKDIKQNEFELPSEDMENIIDFICEITTTDNHHINLRLLDKAARWYNYDKNEWERIIADDMDCGTDTAIIIDIIENKKLRGKLATKEWSERTGKRKSIFYVKYKKLREQYII